MPHYLITNIAYEVDSNDQLQDLPKTLILSTDETDPDIITELGSDYITNVTGWTHQQFSMDPVQDNSIKTIIVESSCANEYFDEYPSLAVLHLDVNTLKAIQDAQFYITNNRSASVAHISLWSDTVWYDHAVDENIEAFTINNEPQRLIDALEDSESRIELNMIDVYSDSIQLTCVPKHCGDDCKVYSRTIENSILFDDLKSHHIIIDL